MEWFENYHKHLMIVPWILIILSAGLIFMNVQQTGSFVDKGVSLSGGVSATIQTQNALTTDQIESDFREAFPQADVAVRSLAADNTYVLEASDVAEDEQQAADELEAYLRSTYNTNSITIETTGPALGDAFFNQTVMGIMLAFLWMGWVVYLYFGDKLSIKILAAVIALTCTILVTNNVLSGALGMTILFAIILIHLFGYLYLSVPSGAVILAAASTIMFTLSVIDLLGVRLQTAGVAAFLMLIGYSVDTDILLSTRVLRTSEGTIMQRIIGAFKTGITMQLTTTIAVLVAYIFTTSAVIEQIMLILLIGLIADIIFTWLQNAGILYWYAKRIGVKER